MSIFSKLFGKQSRSTDISDPRFWAADKFGGGPTASGTTVSADSAMRISTVYACVNLISSLVASLPLQLFKARKGGGQDPITDHPLYSITSMSPNTEQSSYEFREMLQAHLCLRGNSYIYKEMDALGRVTNLIPLHPSRVQPVRLDGRLWYFFTANPYNDMPGVKPRTYQFPAEWIWHLRTVTITTDGLMGLSPITMARESVGMAKGMEEYGAEQFGRKPVPGIVLKTKKTLSPVARDNLKASVQEFATSRRHMAMLLEEDMGFESVGLSNIDSQFLESRAFQVEDICRFFNVPPYLIHHQRDKASTFASAGQLTLNFVIFSLVVPWISRWEASMAKNLLTEKEQAKYFFKFNVNALLRGDYTTRMKGYALGRQWGIYSPNDIRELEDMNPREGGDQYISDPKNITGNQPGNQEPAPAKSKSSVDNVAPGDVTGVVASGKGGE